MVRRFLGSFLLSIALPTVSLAGRTYVATPELGWDAVLPYVRASIVPVLHGSEFNVFVCESQTDRKTITPFNEALSDFAKVLVLQAMRHDSKVAKGLKAVTEDFRRRVPMLGPDERAGYREAFWEELSGAPDVLPKIQDLFVSSRSAGVLRCWVCDRDPSFAPLAKRVRGAR